MLHECGILHRDIKGNNVMVYRGACRLFDLGLAAYKIEGMCSDTDPLKYKIVAVIPKYFGPKSASDNIKANWGDKYTREGDDWWALLLLVYACFNPHRTFPISYGAIGNGSTFWTQMMSELYKGPKPHPSVIFWTVILDDTSAGIKDHLESHRYEFPEQFKVYFMGRAEQRPLSAPIVI